MTPRGRWIKAKYVGTHGRTTSQLVYLYEVVVPGVGVPTSGRYAIVPGDVVAAHPKGIVSMGESGDVYIHYDEGVLAKWNLAFNEPVVLYSSIFAEIESFEHRPGVSWDGDMLRARIIALDDSITDLTPDCSVLVPRRYVVNVGDLANTRILFRAEHVVAVECGGTPLLM